MIAVIFISFLSTGLSSQNTKTDSTVWHTDGLAEVSVVDGNGSE